jgi:hypothetical protein
VPDERKRLEARLADLRICLREARTTDLRQTVADAIALLEGYLSAAYDRESTAERQHVAVSD